MKEEREIERVQRENGKNLPFGVKSVITWMSKFPSHGINTDVDVDATDRNK